MRKFGFLVAVLAVGLFISCENPVSLFLNIKLGAF